MTQDLPETLSPEMCAGKIFEISGTKLDPDAAADLWPRILQHKWLLSEKLGRDVGLRVACIDFLENMEQAREEYLAYQRRDILNEMGAQTISKELWDTISDSQPPKQIVQRKIILPLDQARSVEKARSRSSQDHHFLWTSRHRQDSFCQSHRWGPVLVVH